MKGDLAASVKDVPIYSAVGIFTGKSLNGYEVNGHALHAISMEVQDLAQLANAEIIDIGSENIYILNDGLHYYAKVGNTESYTLGDWDFAQYPEGKPAPVAPVTQPNRFGELSSLLSSDGWTLTGVEPKEDGDILATKPFSTERKGQKISATFSLRYKSSGNYFQGYVDEIGDTNNHKSAIESNLMLVDNAEGKVKAISENLAMFAIRNSAKTEPVQPASEPPMTDFALVTFNAWKKGGKHRIYLKVSENDNAFNEMDYGANDLGYLEVVGENGSEKINNLSTVSNYSKLKDKVIGSAFISALQEYLSQKDIDISDFNGATLKVEIKSDADVLTEKQAAIDAQANADAQEKKAQQDKADLQQAIIKENIAKFGRGAVVNDLSDAVLGNNAKVDAILAGTLLMSDKDFNSFLSFQKSAEPTMTNPDRDYLQSIIEGKTDLSNADDIEAKLTDINKRLDADLEPLFEQAAEAFAQYGIAQAATN